MYLSLQTYWISCQICSAGVYVFGYTATLLGIASVQYLDLENGISGTLSSRAKISVKKMKSVFLGVQENMLGADPPGIVLRTWDSEFVQGFLQAVASIPACTSEPGQLDRGAPTRGASRSMRWAKVARS